MFPLLLALAVVETTLSLSWNRFYFRCGIPVFRTQTTSAVPAPRLPDADRVLGMLKGTRYVDLQIRELDPVTYAIREGTWGGFSKTSYTAIMRGVLRLRPNGTVEIVGNLNWFTLVFVPIFATVPVIWGGPLGLIFPAFLVGLLGSIYSVQSRRFGEVLDVAVQALGERVG